MDLISSKISVSFTSKITLNRSFAKSFRTHYRGSHQRCSVKLFQYSQESTCIGVFFNKDKTCNFTKMKLQHRHFLVNITKFIRTLILKKICNGCFWQYEKRIEFSNIYRSSHQRCSVM